MYRLGLFMVILNETFMAVFNVKGLISSELRVTGGRVYSPCI